MDIRCDRITIYKNKIFRIISNEFLLFTEMHFMVYKKPSILNTISTICILSQKIIAVIK